MNKKVIKKVKCCPYIDSIVSGSPIIQDGKLVGAVTHVFIQDSTRVPAIVARAGRQARSEKDV